MKQRLFSLSKWLCLTLLLLPALSSVKTLAAAPVCSDWAVETVAEARAYGISTIDLVTTDLTQPMTRYDVLTLLNAAYENIMEESYQPEGTLTITDVPWTSKYNPNQLCFPVECGIMVGTSDTTFSPGEPLTRQAFAKVMVSMLYYMNGEELALDTDAWADYTDFNSVADWAKPYVALAYDLGMMSGYEDGRFAPDDYVTWEQAMTIMVRVLPLNWVGIPEITSHSDDDVVSATEMLMVTGGASYDYTVYFTNPQGDVYKASYLGNYGGACLSVTTVGYQDRLTLILEENGCYSDPVTVYVGARKTIVTTEVDRETNLVTVSLDRATEGTDFKLQVVESRNTTGGSLIESREKLSVFLGADDTYTFQGDYNRKYEFTLTSWNETVVTTAYTSSPVRDADIVAQLYEMGGFTSQEEASAAMVTVALPVWKVVNGEKVAGTIYSSVHPLLADLFVEIFQEIFDGPEQFPIYEAGGYSWRGETSSSTHNDGIAVDLNANENWCLYSNGTVVGSCWDPYENQYSITPYGDVVRAFENHGFTWGGDAWYTHQDYMHFNYVDYLPDAS